MGFLKLYSGFQSPGFRIPSNISWISQSGFPKWEECDDAEGICQKLCCTFRVFALLNKPVVFFYFLVSFVVVVVVLELSSNVTTQNNSWYMRRFPQKTDDLTKSTWLTDATNSTRSKDSLFLRFSTCMHEKYQPNIFMWLENFLPNTELRMFTFSV